MLWGYPVHVLSEDLLGSLRLNIGLIRHQLEGGGGERGKGRGRGEGGGGVGTVIHVRRVECLGWKVKKATIIGHP